MQSRMWECYAWVYCCLGASLVHPRAPRAFTAELLPSWWASASTVTSQMQDFVLTCMGFLSDNFSEQQPRPLADWLLPEHCVSSASMTRVKSVPSTRPLMKTVKQYWSWYCSLRETTAFWSLGGLCLMDDNTAKPAVQAIFNTHCWLLIWFIYHQSNNKGIMKAASKDFLKSGWSSIHIFACLQSLHQGYHFG